MDLKNPDPCICCWGETQFRPEDTYRLKRWEKHLSCKWRSEERVTIIMMDKPDIFVLVFILLCYQGNVALIEWFWTSSLYSSTCKIWMKIIIYLCVCVFVCACVRIDQWRHVVLGFFVLGGFLFQIQLSFLWSKKSSCFLGLRFIFQSW